MIHSINNKLILEPYNGTRKVESDQKAGWAQISQKKNLVGLKLLANATISIGEGKILLKAGDTAFFEEETLFNHEGYRKTFSCKEIEKEFIIADYSSVRMVLTQGEL